MQSTFEKIRKNIIVWFFNKSQNTYTTLFKKNKKAWNLNTTALLEYPKESFGYELGQFLQKNNFELLPKLERHDCYHLITGYQGKVEDEIALQYLCFGNGKKSLYLFLVILFGTLLLPDYLKYYLKSYKIGQNANLFHQLDFQKLLHIDLNEIQSFIFSKKQLLIILNINQHV